MKSPTKYDCDVCGDTGYVTVKCLIEDYKRKCPSCYMEKKDENRGMYNLSGKGKDKGR